MANVWLKEHRKGCPLYVDLFEDLSLSYEQKFEEWNNQLNNQSHWKRIFLNQEYAPIKSEQTAHKLNVIATEYFQYKEFRKAFEFYNQALCFSDSQSPSMGHLYLKRAHCFLNMQRYDQCLIDYNFARQSNFPHNMLSSLDEYRDNCLKLLAQIDRKPRTVKLSIDANSDYPCMVNSIKIVKNDFYGVEVVATSDIGIGETVLVEEAFTSISNSYDTMTCFTCQITCANFIPCANCTDVMFCSVTCMKRNDIHKISCGEVYHRMPSYVKFILHSILQAIVSFPSLDLLMKFVKAKVTTQPHNMALDAKMKNYEIFFGLTGSHQDLPILLIHQVYTTLMKMPFILTTFKTKSKQRFLMHLVAHHAQILLCNSYGGFENDQNQQITASMNSVASLFEHSCTPNLIHLSIGNRTIFITNQPIKAGDKLCIDYWPEDDEENDEPRVTFLQKKFNVICKCPKCDPSKPHKTANTKITSDSSFLWIINYRKHMGTDTSSLMKQQCTKFILEYKDHEWTKEKDLVIKTYTECVLDEFDVNYQLIFN